MSWKVPSPASSRAVTGLASEVRGLPARSWKNSRKGRRHRPRHPRVLQAAVARDPPEPARDDKDHAGIRHRRDRGNRWVLRILALVASRQNDMVAACIPLVADVVRVAADLARERHGWLRLRGLWRRLYQRGIAVALACRRSVPRSRGRYRCLPVSHRNGGDRVCSSSSLLAESAWGMPMPQSAPGRKSPDVADQRIGPLITLHWSR